MKLRFKTNGSITFSKGLKRDKTGKITGNWNGPEFTKSFKRGQVVNFKVLNSDPLHPGGIYVDLGYRGGIAFSIQREWFSIVRK